jgi:hypothetical protein
MEQLNLKQDFNTTQKHTEDKAMSNKLKRSVQVKNKKDKESLVKEIRQIVKTAVVNYGFLNTLVVKDDAEATYHNIMDYFESVDKMLEEFELQPKKDH